MIGPGEIFTLFFITLGPLKVFGPFAAQTRHLEPAAVRGIALRVFAVSLIAVAAGGIVGRALLLKWHVSVPALLIATGVIFFLVALRVVMEQYEPAHHPAEPLPAEPMAAALKLTFPTVVTPYGIAALIALLAATDNFVRQELIFAMVAANLVLDFLAMLFAHALTAPGLLMGLRLLGAVLGVLQVALSVQIILHALTDLGVLRAAS